MFNRFCFGVLLLAGLAVSLTGCVNTSSGLDSIAVSPATATIVVGGSTLQLTVEGTFGNGGHTTTAPVTTATWASDAPGFASVDSSGVVTAMGAGIAVITATAQGYDGPVTSTATITVTGASGGAGGDVISLSIIPVTQTVAAPPDTTQFIAIGTTSSGSTQNVTSTAVWTSSSVQIATICTASAPAPCTDLMDGLATAVGKGTTTITAVYTNSDHNTAEGSATLTVTNGAGQSITALTIIPASLTLSATGQPGSFIALGTSGATGLQEDVTNLPELVWTSNIQAYATITSGLTSGNGVAQGVSPGTTPITAEWTNPCSPSPCTANVVTATASVTVISTPAAEPLLSISIMPTTLTTDNLEGTGQFLAYGTFSTAPTLMDITNGFYHAGFPTAGCTAALAAAGSSPCTLTPVNWISAMPSVFTVGSSGAPGSDAGLVTAEGSGNAVIYVTAANPDGTLVYSTTPATFFCPYAAPTYNGSGVMTDAGTCNQYTIAPGLLVTLTVYNAGLNTTNWLVTAPSATGTPDVIHCGPGSATGGSVCTATYPVGTTITLTATQNPADPGPHGTFGGWSWTCATISPNPSTAAGPNFCTVYLGAIDPSTSIPYSNETVGAIFN